MSRAIPHQTVLAIVGPTATGKSDLALALAEEVGGEIVSIDSAQVYRGMDIGTAKPSEEDMARVPHHMIDICDAAETLTVAEYQKLARQAISSVLSRQMTPILVGGSGLYFRAVVDPLDFPGTDPQVRAQIEKEVLDSPSVAYQRLIEIDPEAAERIQPSNVRRVIRALEVIEITGAKFSAFRVAWDEYASIYDLTVAGLTLERADLDRRIEERVDQMITSGLVDEVKRLEALGLRDSLTSVQALGYAQMLAFLDGTLTLDEAINETKRRTRKFARRQLAWFRSDPRVHWFENDAAAAAEFLRKAI